jgi:anti-anti-sigma regulatory factor
MNPKFHAAVHQRDDVTYVKLGGVIDEDNELTDLTDRIPAGTAVIDLAEIERINSCGVRDWVNWLTKIEKGGGRVVLVECSPSIVSQINLVNNFTGQGVVKSFFAPYFCPNCDREKVLLVEASEMGPSPHRAPTCRCDECDGVMDFDDMEDSYFAFLGTAKKVTEAARATITAVVSEFNASDNEKSKIRSRVGSSSIGVGGLGVSSSSLPSVPSLPSMSRAAATPAKGGISGSFSPAASALSIPGTTGTGSGNRTFGGGGSGSGPGSRPGGSRPGGSRPGDSVRAPAVDSQPRFGAGITAPRSPKMVYVLVAVLIAAICVLAVLLFSGENTRRGGVIEPPRSGAAR